MGQFSASKKRSSCITINYQLGIWEYVDDVLLPMEQNNETFFPKSIKNYHQFLIALRKDFEVGLKEELARLDRTFFFYKIGNIILLHLFLDEERDVLKFQKMEKEGLISLVGIHVSIPIYWHSKYF